MLETLQPRLLVYSRADVWPELTTGAVARGVPVVLIGAAVGQHSGRLRWPARSLFRPLYAAFAYAGASSDADAARLARLGVGPAVIEVTGDPRHDQVLERIPDGRVLRNMLGWAAAAEVLVAGSTEPPDEPIVLGAFAQVRRRRPTARLIVCPHAPGPRRSESLVTKAGRQGLDVEVWRGGPAPPGASCLIVERSGVLADLYALGVLAYVGGGMGSHGMHAVVEPASCAVPVIVGPRGHGADTVTLLRCGGAVSLPVRDATHALAGRWEAWLADEVQRTRAGLAARRAVGGGAAQRTAGRLLELLMAEGTGGAGA